ncbi:hypothetical protein HYN49_12855 [Flavobacterium pallidum]|uniref:Uncharacterized protein n=1 Tax=Flavobacterium pallidum TaxID=2172098 RepID=A0A2S1SK14_9FLAO|nr:hypothetical protein HYN49_12855 [Flavobacterium pallidum]
MRYFFCKGNKKLQGSGHKGQGLLMRLNNFGRAPRASGRAVRSSPRLAGSGLPLPSLTRYARTGWKNFNFEFEIGLTNIGAELLRCSL